MEFERSIYEQINRLILQQQEFMEDNNFLYNLDDETASILQRQFFDIQLEINQLYTTLYKSRERATSQVLYLNRLHKSYSTDARVSLTMKEFVMVTVNPPPNIFPKELLQTVKQFMSLSVIEYGVYNIEQRSSESGIYNGFHSHMLFKRSKSPSDVLKELYRVFDPIVPDHQKIYIRSASTEQEVANYCRYMLGSKDDPKKLPKVIVDREMRKTLNIDPIYIVGRSPPTCWDSDPPSLTF